MDYLEIEEDIQFENSKLQKCLYCDNSLPAKSKEHIFNSCWGGTHKTGQIICDDCNSYFSNSKVDDSFQNIVQFIMNAGQFKGERHKTVPTIETNSRYKLEAGGKPVRDSEIKLFKKEDGEVSIAINASSKSEARKMLKANYDKIENLLERELTKEEIEKILGAVRNSTVQQEQVGPLNVGFELPIQEQYQSAAHTMLKCLVMFDVQTAISENLIPIREFARFDKGSWENFGINALSEVAMINNFQKLYVKYNTVEIFYSKALGKIIGCLVILGRIKRWIILSNNYVGPDKVLFVVENLNSGGKIERLRWVSKLDAIPLVSTNLKAPTQNDFLNESQTIISESISIDAPINELKIALEKFTNKHKVVDEVALKRVSELFVDYCVTLIKVNNIEHLSDSDLNRFLEENNFNSILKEYEGKSTTDKDFIKSSLGFFDKLMAYTLNTKM